MDMGRGAENLMPEEVVRGAMIIRVNSLARLVFSFRLRIRRADERVRRGHSAIRLVVLETIVRFLKEGITPVVPLRGSISASGDLSPVSRRFFCFN